MVFCTCALHAALRAVADLLALPAQVRATFCRSSCSCPSRQVRPSLPSALADGLLADLMPLLVRY